MIIFNIRGLESKIAKDELTDREYFHYFVITMVVFSVVPYLNDTNDSGWITSLEILTGIFFTVVPLKMCYDINRHNDNKDFFRRYISLSFVNAMVLIAFVFVLTFIILLFEDFVLNGSTFSQLNSEASFVLMIIFDVLYLLMITKSFRMIGAEIGRVN